MVESTTNANITVTGALDASGTGSGNGGWSISIARQKTAMDQDVVLDRNPVFGARWQNGGTRSIDLTRSILGSGGDDK